MTICAALLLYSRLTVLLLDDSDGTLRKRRGPCCLALPQVRICIDWKLLISSCLLHVHPAPQGYKLHAIF
jgi:hypothetical protein